MTFGEFNLYGIVSFDTAGDGELKLMVRMTYETNIGGVGLKLMTEGRLKIPCEVGRCASSTLA